MFKTFAVLMLLFITLAVLHIESRNIHGVRILTMGNIQLGIFLFRFGKVQHYLAFTSFVLEKIQFLVTVAMKMMLMVIFMPNEKVNYYRHYIVYHILLSINEMRNND